MIIWPVKSASLPKNWELSQSACIFSKGFPPATAGPSGEAGYGQESVMKPSYIIMAAVFAVSSPALANENWQEKDTNGDGQLSRAEHDAGVAAAWTRSEEHTSELQSLMRISYAVFCLKKKKKNTI